METHRAQAHAMIGISQCNDFAVARVQASPEHGQVVGLIARIDKGDLQVGVLGELGSQLLIELCHLRMVVDGGHVHQLEHLIDAGLCRLWVAVTDAHSDDATENVQVAATGLIEQVLHVTLYDHHRPLIVREQCR